MPVKWILFRLANYIVAVFSLLKLTALLTIAGTVKKADLASFIPFVLIHVMVILNCALNVYILSHYFPAKPLTGKIKNIYIASIIILPICFIAEAYYFWLGMQDHSITAANRSSYNVLMWTWFFFLLLELAILTGQLIMRRTLNRKSDLQQRAMIDEIGS